LNEFTGFVSLVIGFPLFRYGHVEKKNGKKCRKAGEGGYYLQDVLGGTDEGQLAFYKRKNKSAKGILSLKPWPTNTPRHKAQHISKVPDRILLTPIKKLEGALGEWRRSHGSGGV